jgi:hypothetical protein
VDLLPGWVRQYNAVSTAEPGLLRAEFCLIGSIAFTLAGKSHVRRACALDGGWRVRQEKGLRAGWIFADPLLPIISCMRADDWCCTAYP